MYLQDFCDKQRSTANKENVTGNNSTATTFSAPAKSASVCVCANGPTAHHRPESKLTTLRVDGLHCAIDCTDIFHIFRAFKPLVSVDIDMDKYGRRSAYVTLLSRKADNAIELLDRRILANNMLQLRKVKKQRKVRIAIALMGGDVCRAFRNGYCLEHCPFGLEHNVCHWASEDGIILPDRQY